MEFETRHQFRETMRLLETQTLEGLDMVGVQLERAMAAVKDQDARLTNVVVADDDRIDGRYLEVHQGVLTLLATQAPVATDLRLVAALLHVVRCIERMGDQCVNIAKLVPLSGSRSPRDERILEAIERMGQVVQSQVRLAQQTFRARDLELAQSLVAADEKVDHLNRDVVRLAIEADDIDVREWSIYMTLVARALERIGDNAVDIGEQTVFVVSGLFRELAEATPEPSSSPDDDS